MQWSRLKELVENRFAEALRGRVRVFVTRYRRSHDEQGRWAILVDGREVVGIGDIPSWAEESRLIAEVGQERGVSAPTAQPEAQRRLAASVQHSVSMFKRSLEGFLNASVDEAFESEDALVRGLVLLDRRVGKRRLASVDLTSLRTQFERDMFLLRCAAEGVTGHGRA
jgi:hypothetical protein